MSTQDDIAAVQSKLPAAAGNLQKLADFMSNTGTVDIGGNTVKTLQTSIDEIEEAKTSAGQSMAAELAAAEGHKNTAEAAAGTATTQAGLADGARQAAEQAESDADQAKSAAETAAGTASTQAELADTARQAAEQAETDAGLAKSDAETAAGAATTQAGLADGARQAAEQAQTDAAAAKTAAETAANTATTKAGEAAASAGIGPTLAQTVRSGYAIKTRRPAVVIDPVTETYLSPAGPVDSGSLITHVRNSAAVVTDGNGVLTSVAADTPRTDHHIFKEGMHQRAGLRVDAQATNMLLHSENFGGASWTRIGLTLTADSAIAPDGFQTADLIDEDGDHNEHYTYRPFSNGGASGGTHSIYAKAAGRDRLLLGGYGAGGYKLAVFDLVAGTVLSNHADGAFIEDVGGGWYRCFLMDIGRQNTFISAGPFDADTVPDQAAWPARTGSAGDGVLLWGAMYEDGGPSSYIKTEASQVTRAADVITIPAASMPSSTAGFSVIIEGEADWTDDGLEKEWFNWGDSTSTGLIRSRIMNTGSHSGRFKVQFFNPGVASALSDNQIVAPGLGVPFRLAIALSASELTICVNGDAATVSHAIALPELADKTASVLTSFNGTLSRLRIFDTALPESALIAETTI